MGGAERALRVFIVAGEHSGDHLGAGLIRALRERVPALSLSGVGGDEMAAEGLRPLFPLSDIAVMGFVPVVARLPRLLRRIRETADAAVAAKPDVLVIVDSPDFTHRVARRVRALAPSIPVVDYVSPTVWAWRPGRAPAMRAYVDHLLALLPFEPEAHRRLGGPPCTYVGHPLIERLDALRPSPAEAAARAAPTLLVLPGSRRSEVGRLTAVFGEAVGRVAEAVPGLDVVLPAVGDRAEEIRARVASWPVAPRSSPARPPSSPPSGAPAPPWRRRAPSPWSWRCRACPWRWPTGCRRSKPGCGSSSRCRRSCCRT